MTITRFDGPDAGDTSRAANGLNAPGESRASLDAAWKELIATAMRRNVVVAVGDHRAAIEDAARAFGARTEPGAPDRPLVDDLRAEFDQGHFMPWDEIIARVLASQPVPLPEPSARLREVRERIAAMVAKYPDDSHGDGYRNAGIKAALRVIDIALDAPCDLHPTAYGQWCELHSCPVGNDDEHTLIDGRCLGYRRLAATPQDPEA